MNIKIFFFVKKCVIALILCLTFSAACKNISEEKKQPANTTIREISKKNKKTKALLIGAWLRNQDGEKDVLELRSDGTFDLVGNEYWAGRNWKLENDSLQLELVRLTVSGDDFSYVNYAVEPSKKDSMIVNLRSNSEKNMANNDNTFVKLSTHYLTNEWVGRWNGVEGTMLDILPKGDFYDIIIYGLDGITRVVSEKVTDKPEIVFYTDDNNKHIIKAGSGKEAEIKWLQGKANCLIISSMETGFCK